MQVLDFELKYVATNFDLVNKIQIISVANVSRMQNLHIPLALSFFSIYYTNMEVLLKCKTASWFSEGITLNGCNLGFKYCLQ